jgi:hypothetical protein
MTQLIIVATHSNNQFIQKNYPEHAKLGKNFVYIEGLGTRKAEARSLLVDGVYAELLLATFSSIQIMTDFNVGYSGTDVNAIPVLKGELTQALIRLPHAAALPITFILTGSGGVAVNSEILANDPALVAMVSDKAIQADSYKGRSILNFLAGLRKETNSFSAPMHTRSLQRSASFGENICPASPNNANSVNNSSLEKVMHLLAISSLDSAKSDNHEECEFGRKFANKLVSNGRLYDAVPTQQVKAPDAPVLKTRRLNVIR